MNREKKIVLTSVVGIGGNILLVAAKALIGILSGSIAIITDAINNLTDALSSTITIIGTKLAGKKPDKKHPYGHGRVEYLTSMVIAIIILFAGCMAIYESIKSFFSEEQASYSGIPVISITVISIAIAAKIGLGLFFKFMGKKAESEVLKASGTDALFDALLSSATLIGIITSLVWGVNIEGYLGIGIGLFILKSGFGILREGFSSVIGERSDKEITDGLKELVCSFPEVKGAYDLILNDYGPSKSIGSIHIEVRDDLTAREIHPLTRKIAAAAYMKYGVILTVGIYARNESDETTKEIKNYIAKIIKEHKYIKQLHGFYLDESTRLVSFDLIFDFENEDSEKDAKDIENQLKEKFPEYDFYIVIDKDFSD